MVYYPTWIFKLKTYILLCNPFTFIIQYVWLTCLFPPCYHLCGCWICWLFLWKQKQKTLEVTTTTFILYWTFLFIHRSMYSDLGLFTFQTRPPAIMWLKFHSSHTDNWAIPVTTNALATLHSVKSRQISVLFTVDNFLSCLAVVVLCMLHDWSATGVTHYKITHARHNTGVTRSKQSVLCVCWFAERKQRGRRK